MNWLKKQATEFTAWLGLALILAAILQLPYWVFVTLGVLLIAIDDEKAKGFAGKVATPFGKWLDSLKKPA